MALVKTCGYSDVAAEGCRTGTLNIMAGEKGLSEQTNVQSDNYWSSTTNADNTSNAWNVNFNNGNVHPVR